MTLTVNNMLITLPIEILNYICTYITPKDALILFTQVSKNTTTIFNDMNINTKFTVICTTIIPDNILLIFDKLGIYMKLIESCKVCWYSTNWYLNGKLHRDNDLPAAIYANARYWYQHGKYHRDNDLPVAINANGSQEWYQHGKLHRDNDKPALVCINGDQYWYLNGKLHRDNDLPSVIKVNGDQYWHQCGKYIKSLII